VKEEGGAWGKGSRPGEELTENTKLEVGEGRGQLALRERITLNERGRFGDRVNTYLTGRASCFYYRKKGPTCELKEGGLFKGSSGKITDLEKAKKNLLTSARKKKRQLCSSTETRDKGVEIA